MTPFLLQEDVVKKKTMKGWLLKGLDKIVWMVLGGVVLALVDFWIKDISPDIVVRHYLETIDSSKTVPHQIGNLVLDYRMPAIRKKDVYKVEVANEGRGPEEDLRLEMGFKGLALEFANVPDLRIFKPSEVQLTEDSFFMALHGLPKSAVATISFLAPRERKKLCVVALSVAGKEKLGRVEPIRGVECE